MFICIHCVSSYLCVYVYTYTIFIHIYIYIYIYTCLMSSFLHGYDNHRHVLGDMYMQIHIHMYAYVYPYVYTHIGTLK